MKLKCPECKEPLNEKMVCSNLHQYYFDEDVLVLMESGFKEKLETWLVDFDKFRADNRRIMDFEQLPDSGVQVNKNLWNARKEDVLIIDSQMDESIKKVLDIGSWNGWLANYLTKKGKEVVAVDYFIHELDGMKAKKHYKNPDWFSIQMDLEDLSVIDEQFDMIVLNRCFPYFTDIHHLINSLKRLLTREGKVIITGINMAQQKVGITEELDMAKKLFKESFQQEFMFKPFKGYVDQDDLNVLKSHQFKIYRYPGLKNRVKDQLKRGNVIYCAVYKKEIHSL